MKILKLLANARVAEISDVARSILNAYETSTVRDDATLGLVMDELRQSNNELVYAIEKEGVVSKHEEADNERDDIMRKISAYLKGSSCTPDQTTARAATELLDIFNRYGLGIARMSYGEESTQINSLLGDWDSEESLANIAKVPYLGEMIEQLRTSQATFEAIYVDYITQLSRYKNTKTATSIKPETLSIINSRLVKYLNSQIEFNKDVFAAFGQLVKTQIDRTNENIKERKKKKLV